MVSIYFYVDALIALFFNILSMSFGMPWQIRLLIQANSKFNHNDAANVDCTRWVMLTSKATNASSEQFSISMTWSTVRDTSDIAAFHYQFKCVIDIGLYFDSYGNSFIWAKFIIWFIYNLSRYTFEGVIFFLMFETLLSTYWFYIFRKFWFIL
jgi:hypothetical protein